MAASCASPRVATTSSITSICRPDTVRRITYNCIHYVPQDPAAVCSACANEFGGWKAKQLGITPRIPVRAIASEDCVVGIRAHAKGTKV